MWIGEQRISLKNMSKNQRAYWREMKRLYEESLEEGYNSTGIEWIETYSPQGRITKEQISQAKELTGEELVGYSVDFDEYRERVDNLISKFEIQGSSKKKFRPTKGQLIMDNISDMLSALREKYGDKVVWKGWCAIPYEVRARVTSSDPKERYSGMGGIADILEAYIDEAYNNEIYNEDYEEDEDIEDYEGDFDE